MRTLAYLLWIDINLLDIYFTIYINKHICLYLDINYNMNVRKNSFKIIKNNRYLQIKY